VTELDSEFNSQALDNFCRERGIAKWLKISARENINIQESFQILLDEVNM